VRTRSIPHRRLKIVDWSNSSGSASPQLGCSDSSSIESKGESSAVFSAKAVSSFALPAAAASAVTCSGGSYGHSSLSSSSNAASSANLFVDAHRETLLRFGVVLAGSHCSDGSFPLLSVSALALHHFGVVSGGSSCVDSAVSHCSNCSSACSCSSLATNAKAAAANLAWLLRSMYLSTSIYVSTSIVL
jgi:hypothetical protein